MLLYLDMCCLKRPFDDQSQPRIRLESEAVLALLALESSELRFVRSPALILENSQNPIKERASRVGQWLTAQPSISHDDLDSMRDRMVELMQFGLKNFDALHVASAEQAGSDALASCDDRFLAVAKRCHDRLKTRVMGIVELAREILK
jgi:predicted nucleic acid-binding protein